MTCARLPLACGVGLLTLSLAASSTLTAQQMPEQERFTFVAANAAKVDPVRNKPLELTITRWSTDAERDELFSVVNERGLSNLPSALADSYAVGYIHWPGGLDYTLRYARRVPRPDGTQDLILVTDSSMSTWWQQTGNTVPASTQSGTPFTVIQVRVNANGVGEGKLSLNSKIVPNKDAGVVLEDYASAPALITELKREAGTTS